MANNPSVHGRLDADRRAGISAIKKVLVSYKCPECSAENQIDLMYIPHKRGTKHPATSSSFWCSKCQVRTMIDYRVFKRRDGTPRLKVYHLKVNEVDFVKRFKVLAWC